MKRSLWAAFLCMGLALFALWAAWMRVDREKRDIVISQEVLSGDPAAAAGVTLRIGSHWEGHLLWNTEYVIGSGKEAESEFTFSAREVVWEWEGKQAAKADFLYGASFGTAITDGGSPVYDPSDMPYSEIAQAVAAEVPAGTTREKTIKISDYYDYYPVSFNIEGSSVEYQGDYEKATAYLTELFRIPLAEDRIAILVEKNQAGECVSFAGRKVSSSEKILIADTSAFGTEGCYYAFCLEDMGTGERRDRGENSGIFFLPFKEAQGWMQVDLTRMEKLCALPEGVVPEAMLLEEEKGYLYLTVKKEGDYSLLVYELKDGFPVLSQWVALGQKQLFCSEESFEENPKLEDEWAAPEAEVLFPEIQNMTLEEGGLLMTWSDNSFSFVAEEEDGYRLWCSGRFPENQEREYLSVAPGIWARNILFPVERECLFDGERLVLAAFEGWNSPNVLLAVYNEAGEAYTGLYRHSGEREDLAWGTRRGVMVQGRDCYAFLNMHYAGEAYVRGTGEPVRPLELLDR